MTVDAEAYMTAWTQAEAQINRLLALVLLVLMVTVLLINPPTQIKQFETSLGAIEIQPTLTLLLLNLLLPAAALGSALFLLWWSSDHQRVRNQVQKVAQYRANTLRFLGLIQLIAAILLAGGALTPLHPSSLLIAALFGIVGAWQLWRSSKIRQFQYFLEA